MASSPNHASPTGSMDTAMVVFEPATGVGARSHRSTTLSAFGARVMRRLPTQPEENQNLHSYQRNLPRLIAERALSVAVRRPCRPIPHRSLSLTRRPAPLDAGARPQRGLRRRHVPLPPRRRMRVHALPARCRRVCAPPHLGRRPLSRLRQELRHPPGRAHPARCPSPEARTRLTPSSPRPRRRHPLPPTRPREPVLP